MTTTTTTTQRDSPLRRNSFAGQTHQTRRRRVASLSSLSPAAKARRSLVPRKSILKGPDDATQSHSIDMTRDFRKSLGRRVSFANHAHVRLFQVPDHNTNSTASPQSSPAATNDENAYPGASSFRRRASARHSVAFSEGAGEESMDMDSDDAAFSPSAFFRAGSDVPEDNDPDNADDMDVTEVVPQNLVRKRSLSFGVSRQPLANLSILQASPDTHNNQEGGSNDSSYVQDDSAQSQSFTSEGDVSQAMEFTVPLIRPPEPPSDAWLALRSATHSGNTPYIPSSDDDVVDDRDDVQEMELTDAVSRLRAAQASLGLGEGAGDQRTEDSFTSTEDSFVDEDVDNNEDGNHTVNVTQLMRRVSIGPGVDSTVTSAFSSQEQSRDELVNQIAPDIPLPVSLADSRESYPEVTESPPSTATPPLYPEIPADDDPVRTTVASQGTSVFSAPQPSVEMESVPSVGSSNFTFTPKPRTPAPQARPRSSSPTKPPPSPRKFTAAFAPPVTHPSHKRSSHVFDTDHSSQPSPAKRPAGTERLSITPGRGTGAARVLLSPSKASPLKMPPFHHEDRRAAGPSQRTSMGFRRPSGYFAQRKSLGNTPDLSTPTNTGATLIPVSSGQNVVVIGDSTRDGTSGDATDRRPTSPTTMVARKAQIPMADEEQSNHDDDIQWRTEIEEEDVDGAKGPQISIEQFFEMTGIRFMDDIAAPRRSIVHPSVLRPSRRLSTEAQIPLAEYVVAMAINVPQLELYSHVSKDLQSWVERIKEIHREAEEEAQKATPPLFQEFVTTDESGQSELLHQLKLIKVHNHAQAKSEWYDWKMQWVEQLYKKADESFKDLEADAKAIEGIMQQAQDIVPGLQQEYDQLISELAKEKAEVAELETCDQDYLNELKATIAEQSAELDTFQADVEESKAKLDRLQEKLNEVKSQKKEVTSVIEDAERRIHMQKNSTRAEVFQLKDELEVLQDLHMWKATKVLPELFEFTYASSYFVSIPCHNLRPVVADIQIRRSENVKAKHKEVSPLLSALVLRRATQLVTEHRNPSIHQIIQRLGDYWSSCSQLQAQLKLVSIKFPLSIRETPTGFSTIATVLFPSLKAKALISFIFDTPIFSSWPVSIQSMRCDVRVAYGPVDRDRIQNAVTARLQQVSPTNNHACLLDACMEALECYA